MYPSPLTASSTGQGHYAQHTQGRCGHNIGRAAAQGVREVSACTAGDSFGLRWHRNRWWGILFHTGGQCGANCCLSWWTVAGRKFHNVLSTQLAPSSLPCLFSPVIIMPICVALLWMLSVCVSWWESCNKIFSTMQIWISYQTWIPTRWQISLDGSWRTVTTVCRARQHVYPQSCLVRQTERERERNV